MWGFGFMFKRFCTVLSKSEVIEAFDSPRFALEESLNNIADIKARGDTYFSTNPCKQMDAVDKDSGDYVRKIVCDPVPKKIRHLCATTIYDIRHTLDQITCAAVWCKTRVRPDHLYFPIAPNGKKDFERRVRTSLPDELWGTYDGFAVYRSGQSGKTKGDLICILNEAAKRKHTIHCSACASARSISNALIRNGSASRAFFPPLDRPEANEIILGVYAPGTEFYYSGQLEVAIGIYGTDTAIDGDSAGPVLKIFHSIASEVLRKVEETCVAAFSSI